MHIEDNCGILHKLIEISQKENDREHGALAIAEITTQKNKEIYYLVDSCMVNEIGGEEKKNRVIIPARISYILLLRFKKEGKIPVIIHTHSVVGSNKEQNVRFSPPDIEFMKKFSMYAANMGDIHRCLFILTDGVSIEYAQWKLETKDFTFTEDLVESDGKR